MEDGGDGAVEWIPAEEGGGADGGERAEEAHVAAQAAMAGELAGIEEALALKKRLLQQMLAEEGELAALKATDDERRMQAALARMQEQASRPPSAPPRAPPHGPRDRDAPARSRTEEKCLLLLLRA